MSGYAGRIARVDLGRGSVDYVPLDAGIARKYIGGSGLGAKILYDETGPDTDPLGPENLLIYMTGPFAGTRVPSSGRHAVVAKSPLTGIFAESDVGGFWGRELKRAGLDGIVITGRAEWPVYLWINDDGIEIRDARPFWGLDAYDADEALRRATHRDAKVSTIGPAGERLVRISAIMHDGKDARPAGRCGLGAVMGSKNLKAVVVRGTRNIDVADQKGLAASVKALVPTIRDRTEAMRRFGTSGGVATHESMGNFPLRNWSLSRWPEGAAKISGQAMASSILVKPYFCAACIIGCGRIVHVKEGRYAGPESAGPEYETVGMLGGMCLVDDLEAIAKANELCNRYGLDTISTGAVIAFAMEAFERGIITPSDTGGIDLRFGNADALIEMIERIGTRSGLGETLGEGVRRAAEAIGGTSREYALHVKGLEPPAHDPRCYHGVALAYATSNRGACHLQGFTHAFERVLSMPDIGIDRPHERHNLENKAELVAKLQNLMSMMDSLKACKFLLFGGVRVTHLVEWLQLVTGWDVGIQEFMTTGERLYNLKRLYNNRCGITRVDDNLPPRFTTEKRAGEGLVVSLPHLGRMLSDYYDFRGWNAEGIPRLSTLERLGLEEEAERARDAVRIEP